MIALLALAAAQQQLSWSADAAVHDGARVIAIQSRTVLGTDGSVNSASWPVEQGEAKGLRRMIISADGGWIERAGTRLPMPADMLTEERQQFGFYLELQQAARWCDGQSGQQAVVATFGRTSFRCVRSRLTRAANWLGTVRQDFRLFGLWRDGGFVFPRRMELLHDGRPYFDMTVSRFGVR